MVLREEKSLDKLESVLMRLVGDEAYNEMFIVPLVEGYVERV